MFKLLESVHYNYHYYAILVNLSYISCPHLRFQPHSLAALGSHIAGTERA